VRVLDYIGLPVKRLGVTDPCRVDRSIPGGHLARTATPVFDIAALKTAAPCSYMEPWRGGLLGCFSPHDLMIGFIGLSHLGLNYSLATAAKGFDVLCFDPSSTLVHRLESGDIPIEEPGFKELFAHHGSRLHFTSDPVRLGICSVVFYSLDVKTNERNESDLGPLTALIDSTAPSLALGSTAVVLSQVRPGFMRALTTRIESPAASWYYQAETLVLGDAVRRAHSPERIIVGAHVPDLALSSSYKTWLEAFEAPVLVMRLESAEFAKIAINCFLASSVCTTNTLAELCEAIGADWSEIAPALHLDRRIGPYAYLNPTLGIAGGRLERDLVTVKSLSAEHGTESGIVDAWQRNSAHAKFWALRALERGILATKPEAKIAVWGLAYKQDTHSTRNSAAVELLRTLSGCELHAYDQAAQVEQGLIPNVTIHGDALSALTEADVLVIMTPWRQFGAVAPSEIRSRMAGSLVLDPYGVLDRSACERAGLLRLQIGA